MVTHSEFTTDLSGALSSILRSLARNGSLSFCNLEKSKEKSHVSTKQLERDFFARPPARTKAQIRASLRDIAARARTAMPAAVGIGN